MPQPTAPPTPSAATKSVIKTNLRILATTDLHVHLHPYDYYRDEPTPSKGLAQLAPLIAQARAEAGLSILLDNGDFLLGNPMGDYLRQNRVVGEDTPHPMIATMNWLGYDAIGLGNHDFDYGLDFLGQTLRHSQCPVICSNIEFSRRNDVMTDTLTVQPWYILDRMALCSDGKSRAVKIGVIAFVPAQVNAWCRSHLQGIATIGGILEAARFVLPQVRAAGADIVVALAHSGIGTSDLDPGTENTALALALVPGLDAIVAGHSHQVFPSDDFADVPGINTNLGTLFGKPATQPGFWGSHLGVIDLDLEWNIQGWVVRSGNGAVRAILPSCPADREVLALSQAAHEATLTDIRRPIGHSRISLNTYFARIVPSDCTRIVADAQLETARALLQGSDLEHLPVLSASAPFKAGGRGGATFYTDIPMGDLALRHLKDLYPFPNRLSVVRVNGKMIRDWLEHSAGMFRQIVPGGRDQALINQDFPSYNFDTIHGLTYRINLSQPARFNIFGDLLDESAHRICDVAIDGIRVDPDADLIVATNSYRAGGGGDFPPLKKGAATLHSCQSMTLDVLVRHVVSQRSISRVAGAGQKPWRFCPMPGTSVVFDSGEGALAHVSDVRDQVQIEPVDGAPQGQARFRIWL